MTVRVYRSGDIGAPVWHTTSTRQTPNQHVNGMIDVLQACLVDGYGSKPGAGWTKPFHDVTNATAYFRNDDATGTGSYYRVINKDRSPMHSQFGSLWGQSSSYSSYAAVNAYGGVTETSPGSLTFTHEDEFGEVKAPLAYDYGTSSSYHMDRGNWIIVANNRTAYLFYNLWEGDASPDWRWSFIAMGDFQSNVANDSGGAMLMGVDPKETYSVNYPEYFEMRMGSDRFQSAGNYTFMRNNIFKTETGKYFSLVSDPTYNGGQRAYLGNLYMPFPNPIDGKISICKSRMFENNGGYVYERGTLTGIWSSLHRMPFSPLFEYDGTGDLLGKKFLVIDCGEDANLAQVMVEISDTWEY